MGQTIKEGSLVKMKNRNVKGQGIVIERVRDVNLYAGFDLSEAFVKCFDKNHKEYLFRESKSFSMLWHHRQDLIRDINDTIMERDEKVNKNLLNEFWNYNHSYSVRNSGELTKIRTDFVLVKWLKAPSDYTHKPYKRYQTGLHWFPTHIIANF